MEQMYFDRLAEAVENEKSEMFNMKAFLRGEEVWVIATSRKVSSCCFLCRTSLPDIEKMNPQEAAAFFCQRFTDYYWNLQQGRIFLESGDLNPDYLQFLVSMTKIGRAHV